ncbi:MAG: PorP/SprF family type IX secretion system membrane protein [Bacteroidetes bacterium]|nr:PorP/SprF family type IX secretion system membrane protein [Bacteroidota bacterium]
MKKFSLTILLAIVGHCTVFCQYFQFSQYNFTPTRVNPGWLGLTKFVTVDFDYRNQKTGGDFSINSNFFAVAYPLVRQSTGTPWAGVGISLMDDRSGGIFKTQEASLSYAVNISTGKYESLSIGFRGLMRSQRIDYSGLVTGSQYIDGRGFDPSIFNGENAGNLNIRYNTFSTGLLWTKTDRRGSLVSQLDGAIFDFNKPNNSFTDDNSQLASTLVTHGALLLNKKAQLNTYSDVLLTYGSGKAVLNFGARWQYDLNPSSRSLTDKVDLIARYIVGRSGMVGLQFHNEKFSFGLSYDFPVFIKNYGNTGAFEIGLEYRSPVNPKNRKAKSKQAKKPIQTSKSVTTKKSTMARPPSLKTLKKDSVSKVTSTEGNLPHDSVTSVTIEKNDSINTEAKAGKIKHEPLIIEKITLHFHFEYNSIDLDDETEKFLNDLSATLTENENLKLKITGHTDNRGNEKYNLHLSLKRAEEVKRYLAKTGIDPQRVIVEGKGMSEPLNDNSSEEERSKNRRVEITMYSDKQ